MTIFYEIERSAQLKNYYIGCHKVSVNVGGIELVLSLFPTGKYFAAMEFSPFSHCSSPLLHLNLL